MGICLHSNMGIHKSLLSLLTGSTKTSRAGVGEYAPSDKVKTWMTKAILIPTLHYTAVLQNPKLNTLTAQNQNKQVKQFYCTNPFFLSFSQALLTCSEHQSGNVNIQNRHEGKSFFKIPSVSGQHQGLTWNTPINSSVWTSLTGPLPVSPYKCWHSTSSVSISISISPLRLLLYSFTFLCTTFKPILICFPFIRWQHIINVWIKVITFMLIEMHLWNSSRGFNYSLYIKHKHRKKLSPVIHKWRIKLFTQWKHYFAFIQSTFELNYEE